MKRLISVLFIAIIAVETFGILTGCDSSVKRITARCIIDNDSIQLPLKPTKAFATGNGTDFIIGMTLDEIKTEIDGMNTDNTSYATEIIGNALHIEKTSSDNGVHYYVVIKQGDEWYSLKCPSAYIDGCLVLIPIHYIDSAVDTVEKGEEYDIIADREYKVNCTKEQIREFYSANGFYDIEVLSSEVTQVKVKADAEIPSGYYRHDKCTLNIHFREEADSLYMTFTASK